MKKPDMVSIASVVDPMLLAGSHSRQEIMDAIRTARPDYKYPSSAVTNRFIALVQAGKTPAVKAAAAKGGIKAAVEGRVRKVRSEQMAKIEAWASRMDKEVADGFVRFHQAVEHNKSEPKPRKVWA